MGPIIWTLLSILVVNKWMLLPYSLLDRAQSPYYTNSLLMCKKNWIKNTFYHVLYSKLNMLLYDFKPDIACVWISIKYIEHLELPTCTVLQDGLTNGFQEKV